MELTFTWDHQKAEQNLKKHGISFEEANSVFADFLSSTIPDPLHSVGELRLITIGQSSNGKMIVVVHTDKNDTIRIISARPATKQERKTYEEAKKT